MKFLLTFDLEFDLKFEISDGKNLVNFMGRTFYLPGKHEKFRGKFRTKFRRNFGNFVSNFPTFFGNFVQQKGGAIINPGERSLICDRGAREMNFQNS